MKSIIPFLKSLEKNNNREWFNENKADYLEAKEAFESLIDRLIPQIQSIDPRVAGATAKNSVFRIYKDIRFSKDKTPYKTQMGAYMIGGGRKSQLPGYYLHLQPGQSFLAGGMYQPNPDHLKAIRNEIRNFPEDLRKILEDDNFKRTFSLYDDDRLTRPPQGFSADDEGIEWIKNKHFIASMKFTDDLIISENFESALLKACKGLLPLNNFLYRAVHH